MLSPSLRGSGLKSSPTRALTPIAIRLPLYEGVDWNQSWKHASHYCKGLPLYEGVDWNRYTCVICCCSVGLPLYEGVDWNLCSCARLWHRYIVSLFTREWIEILSRSLMPKKKRSLPLYEGVDWNVCWVHTGGRWTCLPLYEGVDWELVFIAKKWYNRRYEKRISSNKLRKWFDRQTMGSNQRILSIRK